MTTTLGRLDRLVSDASYELAAPRQMVPRLALQSSPLVKGYPMTTSTRSVVMLASVVICGLAMFPPRAAELAQSPTRVSRGFLWGDSMVAEVVLSQDGRGGRTRSFVPTRLDGTRFVFEVAGVVSAATAIAMLLQLMAGTKPNPAERL